MGINTTKVYDNVDTLIVQIISSNRYYEVNADLQVDPLNIIIDKNPGNIQVGIDGETLYGTENSPYEIWCIEDLVEWSKNYSQYETNYIKLGQSLNFKSELSYFDCTTNLYNEVFSITDKNVTLFEILNNTNSIGFIPIESFSGVFDGAKHELKNIYINSSLNHVGLFANSDGIIFNLIISGKIIQNSPYDANSNCGGIVGEAKENCNINNCTNYTSISSNSYAGGIAGRSKGIINSCINYADIENNFVVGGICGTGNATITNCINIGNITANTYCAAGILGGDYWSTKAVIYNCCNKGNITCKESSIYAKPGGIFGYMTNAINSLDIINCYNVGNISSTLNWNNFSGSIIAIIRTITPNTHNCFYLETGPAQTSIATPYSKSYIQSQDFIDELNNYINSNTDGIDTKGWTQWIQGEDGYPTLNFNNL